MLMLVCTKINVLENDRMKVSKVLEHQILKHDTTHSSSLFCSIALTSTGWVQMTIKPRHCPPFLSSTAVIESQ